MLAIYSRSGLFAIFGVLLQPLAIPAVIFRLEYLPTVVLKRVHLGRTKKSSKSEKQRKISEVKKEKRRKEKKRVSGSKPIFCH